MALLGAGLGPLLADRLPREPRRAVGWTLLLIGAATTIPLAIEVLGGGRLSTRERGPGPAAGKSRSESEGQLGRRAEFARP